jgi:hypothetical protein
MSRPLGGYIGHRPVPATAALNSAAGGMWTLRDAQRFKQAGTWPSLFSPTLISGLQLWLDAADDGSLFDSTSGGSAVAADGAVARWQDKSGNNRHATQGTSGSRPVRKTATQAGLDTLRFSGAQSLSVDSVASFFGGSGAPQFTLIAVASQTDNTGNTVFSACESSSASSNQTSLWLRDSAITLLNRTGASRIVFGTPPTSGFSLVSVVSRSESLELFTNRSAADTNSDSFTGTVTRTIASVGVLPRGSGQDFLDGDVCELVVYNTALSSTDRGRVESYLAAKWGIA